MKKLFLDLGPGKLNTEAWGNRWKEFDILGIEANIERYNNLKNEYPGKLFNLAVWSKDGISISGENHPRFGFIAGGFDNTGKDIDVKTTTVDTIVKESNIDYDEIAIWADIEGSELKMLEGAVNTLPKVNWINLEVRNHKETENWCTAEEIYNFLEPLGFKAATSLQEIKLLEGHRDVIFTK